MKRIIVVAILMFFTALLFSHPASSIKAEFDLETATLTVKFSHSVGNTQKHYIEEVIVYLNNDEVIRQALTTQQTEHGGNLIYIIPDAKENDTIKIKTTCNKFGSKKTKLTVSAQP